MAESDGMRKGAIVAYLKYCTDISLEGLRNTGIITYPD
jgi:hypothetical protein